MHKAEKYFTQKQLRFGYLAIGVFLLATVWGFGWAGSTASAFAYAGIEEQLVGNNKTLSEAADEVQAAIALLLLTLAACWFLTRSTAFGARDEAAVPRKVHIPGNLNTPWTLFGFLGIYLLYMGICIGQDSLGGLMSSWLSPNDIVAYPRPASPTAEHAQATLLIYPTAGPTEEPFFAAALPLLARALIKHNGWALTAALGLSVTLRVAFHVYYGPATIPTFTLWAAAAVLLWWFTGQLLALVCAHAAYNALAAVSSYPDLLPFSEDSASLLLIALPALAFTALLVLKILKGTLIPSVKALLRSGPATAYTPVRVGH